MQIYAWGYKGKYYPTLNQAMGKMIGEIAYDISRVSPAMEKEIREYMKRAVYNVTSKFTKYKPGPNTGDRLQDRSGEAKRQLRNRQTVRRTDSNKYNFKFIGSIKGPEYLNIQEDGGTLTADDGGYIVIPLPAALDGRGLPLRKSPREWKNTFVRKSKRGKLVIFQKRGRKIVPLYILQKSVTITPRLRLLEGLKAAAPYFERKLLDQVDRILSGR